MSIMLDAPRCQQAMMVGRSWALVSEAENSKATRRARTGYRRIFVSMDDKAESHVFFFQVNMITDAG